MTTEPRKPVKTTTTWTTMPTETVSRTVETNRLDKRTDSQNRLRKNAARK